MDRKWFDDLIDDKTWEAEVRTKETTLNIA
jgi:hypothetical protein